MMSNTDIKWDYSVDNAVRFGWSSVSGQLNSERVDYLKRYIVGRRVLDAGCGGGGYVDFLSKQGYDVTGIDKFGMFLSLATERSYNGRFLQADLNGTLPFDDNTFDTTYCFDVLEHVNDETALQELVRVTKQRIIVAVPYEDCRSAKYLLTYYPYLDLTHLRYYTPESLIRLTNSAGAKKVQVLKECRVPIESLVRREVSVESKYRFLNPLYRIAFSFLVQRVKGPDWFIGLIAIIDLL